MDHGLLRKPPARSHGACHFFCFLFFLAWLWIRGAVHSSHAFSLSQWAWQPFKAATQALQLTLKSAPEIIERHRTEFPQLLSRLRVLAADGTLTDDAVLDDFSTPARPLLSLLRASNVTLKWILLHRKTLFRLTLLQSAPVAIKSVLGSTGGKEQKDSKDSSIPAAVTQQPLLFSQPAALTSVAPPVDTLLICDDFGDQRCLAPPPSEHFSGDDDIEMMSAKQRQADRAIERAFIEWNQASTPQEKSAALSRLHQKLFEPLPKSVAKAFHVDSLYWRDPQLGRSIQQRVMDVAPIDHVCDLWLLLSATEFQYKARLKSLDAQKGTQLPAVSAEIRQRLSDLAAFYAPNTAMSALNRNPNQALSQWFSNLTAEVDTLLPPASSTTGQVDLTERQQIETVRKVRQLQQALTDVQQFASIDQSIQAKQALVELDTLLKKVARFASLHSRLVADLDTVTDCSYALSLVAQYQPLFHHRLCRQPASLSLLRSLFVKLGSCLAAPLLRATQARSPDDVAIAEFYSRQLALHCRSLLDPVPSTVFRVLAQVSVLLQRHLVALPAKFERQHLSRYAQLDHRRCLAECTHQLSTFASGLLQMNTALIGLAKLDPRELLVDGLRKHLIASIAQLWHRWLTFQSASANAAGAAATQELERRLTELGRRQQALHDAFEYIADYLCVHAHRLWHQELHRLLAFAVEQESNSFLKTKVFPWLSSHQSETAPIPSFVHAAFIENVDDEANSGATSPSASSNSSSVSAPSSHNRSALRAQSINFMGRLSRELLRETDPFHTVYSVQHQCWFNRSLLVHLHKNSEKSALERSPQTLVDWQSYQHCSMRTWQLMHDACGAAGVSGLDRLLCLMMSSESQQFFGLCGSLLLKLEAPIDKFFDDLQPLVHAPPAQVLTSSSTQQQSPPQTTTVHNFSFVQRMYTSFDASVKMTTKLAPTLIDTLCRLGQCQLLRRHLLLSLHCAASTNAHSLFSAVSTLNLAVLEDARAHYSGNADAAMPSEDLLFELSKYLSQCGIDDPLSRIYTTCEQSELSRLPVLFAVLIISLIDTRQLKYHSMTISLTGCGNSSNGGVPQHFDGTALLLGIITALRQLHSDRLIEFLAMLCQYARCAIVTGAATFPNADAKSVHVVLYSLSLSPQYTKHSASPCSPPAHYHR